MSSGWMDIIGITSDFTGLAGIAYLLYLKFVKTNAVHRGKVITNKNLSDTFKDSIDTIIQRIEHLYNRNMILEQQGFNGGLYNTEKIGRRRVSLMKKKRKLLHHKNSNEIEMLKNKIKELEEKNKV